MTPFDGNGLNGYEPAKDTQVAFPTRPWTLPVDERPGESGWRHVGRVDEAEARRKELDAIAPEMAELILAHTDGWRADKHPEHFNAHELRLFVMATKLRAIGGAS